jgi:DHA1 family multidrug resistance protein-like MFS transporter
MHHDWKRSFGALWIAQFLAIAGFQTSTPILPFYLKELGVTGTAALNNWNGVINAATSLSLAVFAPIWGSLADSYGKKLMLLRATIGGTLFVGLMALVAAPWQLLVLKILQGVVTGTVAAATVLTATIVPEEEAGYRLGLLQVAVYLGASLGPLIGGIVSDLAGNRATFLITALLLALASFLVSRYVMEDSAPVRRPGSFLARLVPDLGVLRSSPVLLGLLLCLFAIQLSNGIANPILPLVVMDLNGGAAGSSTLSGLIIGASSLSGALAAALIGRFSARFGYGRTLVACLFLASAFCLPQGFARSPYLLLALRVASGAFLGGTLPSLNALIAKKADRNRHGAVFGLSSSLVSVGLAIGPVLGALVATTAGYPSVFFATAAVLALTGLGMGLGIGRRETPGDSLPPPGPALPRVGGEE